MNPRRTWMLLLVFVAALAITPSASAKPGYFVFGGHHSISFSLQGSNGYRIEIGKEGDGYVHALASRKNTVATYSARSLESNGNGIKARFPGVGRVSVRFRPQGPPRESKPYPFPECRGGTVVKQFGYFVGAIRFRGERGYTSARARRVKGMIETTAKEVCKRSPSDGDSESPTGRTELWVKSESGNQGVGFDALQLGDPLDLTSFGAMVVERRGGMRIFRWTNVTGEREDVVVGDTRPYPLSATVTPPAPFSGSAEYERTPDGDHTWTGSLAVTLPGLGRVALTGSSFDPRLCQLSGCSGSGIDGHALPLIASAHYPKSR